MKRVILITALLFASATTFISCRDTTEKETTVVREVEVERTEPAEKQEGILERSAKKVDQKVNKEIDEEIDKIGDDN